MKAISRAVFLLALAFPPALWAAPPAEAPLRLIRLEAQTLEFQPPLAASAAWRKVTVVVRPGAGGPPVRATVDYRSPLGTLAEFDPPIEVGGKVRWAYGRLAEKGFLFRDEESEWKEEEVARIAATLDRLPALFLELAGSFPVDRQKEPHIGTTRFHPDTAAVAWDGDASGIWVGNRTFEAAGWIDPWSCACGANALSSPEAIFLHEAAHMLDFRGGHQGRAAAAGLRPFEKISWEGRDEPYKVLPGAEGSFVTDYARTNPWEDFADSVAAYVFFPERLRELSREKFDYIQQAVFDGWEPPLPSPPPPGALYQPASPTIPTHPGNTTPSPNRMAANPPGPMAARRSVKGILERIERASAR